jgi:hypothetical protein
MLSICTMQKTVVSEEGKISLFWLTTFTCKNRDANRYCAFALDANNFLPDFSVFPSTRHQSRGSSLFLNIREGRLYLSRVEGDSGWLKIILLNYFSVAVQGQ